MTLLGHNQLNVIYLNHIPSKISLYTTRDITIFGFPSWYVDIFHYPFIPDRVLLASSVIWYQILILFFIVPCMLVMKTKFHYSGRVIVLLLLQMLSLNIMSPHDANFVATFLPLVALQVVMTTCIATSGKKVGIMTIQYYGCNREHRFLYLLIYVLWLYEALKVVASAVEGTALGASND